MILDTGICTIFRKTDTTTLTVPAGSTAQADTPGSMPKIGYTKIGCGWYGELSYETTSDRAGEGRKEQKIDGRIRLLQNRTITQNDVVVLEELDSFTKRSAGAPVYRITRAYHGKDDDGPTLISDLSLEVIRP